MRPQKPLIIITPGDPEGIGPEIVMKTLSRVTSKKFGCDFLLIGAKKPFQSFLKKNPVAFLAAPESTPRTSLFLPGFQSGWSIETAVKLLLQKKAAALVTGPIHKARLNAGGYLYPGHTEMLEALCTTKQMKPSVTMMLANSALRVALVTTHVAQKKVSSLINKPVLRTTIQNTLMHLSCWWGIANPRIAVLALNPHAGEGGLFGTEEQNIILPVIREFQKKSRHRFSVTGPYPSDTFFVKQLESKGNLFDAAVCMYHDQGLIPVKLLDFSKTVNITLGLPIIRTSVDHGTGFDIVGKGIADPSSLQEAIRMAVHFAKQHSHLRNHYETTFNNQSRNFS